MTDEIKGRLQTILLSLLDALGSKKFQVAMVAGATGWYNTGDIRYFIGALLTYVGAQAFADFGKEKAKIEKS